MHGSPEAKKAGEVEIQQHSAIVARGKYVHGFESESLEYNFRSKVVAGANAAHRYPTAHKVKPDQVDGYKKAALVLAA